MIPAVVAWVERTRAEQRLPLRVESPAILDEIAAIIAGSQEGGDSLARAS